MPYFIEWDDMMVHPSAGADSTATIQNLQIAGDSKRIREWLGPQESFDKEDIDFTFVAPHGQPGLLSVTVGGLSSAWRVSGGCRSAGEALEPQ